MSSLDTLTEQYESIKRSVEEVVTTIDTLIDERQAEITRLTEARNILTGSNEQVKSTEAKPTRKPARKAERKSAEKHTTRSEQRRARLAKARKQHKNGNHAGRPSVFAQDIINLTKQGLSAKEVAEEVGCSLNYVYLVRRESLQAA